MARIKMGDQDYDHRPREGVVVAFKAGKTYPNVKRAWADAAIAHGAKELPLRSRRKADD